jgi:predicted  nucleic acid-binding Zn-ribbon protein
MLTQSYCSGHEQNVILFAPTSTDVLDDADQLDEAGQAILQLLNSAAGVAEENNRRVLNRAWKLSHRLNAAEDRIAELEEEVATYRQKAERAEQWLHRVYTEIEGRFLAP